VVDFKDKRYANGYKSVRSHSGVENCVRLY